MLDLLTYRLVERRSDAGSFEFVDPDSDRIVGVATPAARPPTPDRPPSILSRLMRFRVVLILYALASLPILAMRILISGRRFPPKESRARLDVWRPGGDHPGFALRDCSGFLYDSRRVYDGQGGLIAQFRSRSKTTARGGFDIIDLRGMPDDWSDIGDRPWLGVVENAGTRYRLRLVGHRDAGTIDLEVAPGPPSRTSRGDCTVEVSAGLRDDPTSLIVILAAALTVAWQV